MPPIIDFSLMAMPVCSSRIAEAPLVNLPISKSVAARVLIGVFWSGGCLDCLVLPDADDTRELRDALSRLALLRNGEVVDSSFYLGEGGTSLRFFLPVIASLPGVLAEVDCGPGQRRRPISPLLEALRSLGAVIKGSGIDGNSAPFMVKGDMVEGGVVTIDSTVSSQFVSALMLTAPVWKNGVEIKFRSASLPPVSFPYIYMTARVMRAFGLRVDVEQEGVRVSPGIYSPLSIPPIEGDWSAASYFYEYVLTGDGYGVRLGGLEPPEKSLQGDSRIVELMKELGVDTYWDSYGEARLSLNSDVRQLVRQYGVKWNLRDTPDLVPALAVGCCLAGVPFHFYGVGHLRHKETDRLRALSKELNKAGFEVGATNDSLFWEGAGAATEEEVIVSTYADHRIAMAFGVVSRCFRSLTVEAPEVVTKSYPRFWYDLASLNNDNKE